MTFELTPMTEDEVVEIEQYHTRVPAPMHQRRLVTTLRETQRLLAEEKEIAATYEQSASLMWSQRDRLIQALIEIAEGHVNPGGLAQAALESVQYGSETRGNSSYDSGSSYDSSSSSSSVD